VLFAFGATLGERDTTLDVSLAALARLPKTTLIARSTWHETEPVGGPPGQPRFLNGAILLDTAIAPQSLATELRRAETQLGRRRHIRWDARNIDLDLLLYGGQSVATPDLQIPHPRMAHRRFVLDPACEIAGEMIHPPSGWTLAALRRHWHANPRTISIQSADTALASWLASQVREHLEAAAHDQSRAHTVQLVRCDERPTMTIQLGGSTTNRRPVVHITATDRRVVLQESLAAITAAWPE
jgi:2-amino-4-hydroxy-6-hydroxymethyldihydropteridine diphosphokinase